jgi:hypothetical protein
MEPEPRHQCLIYEGSPSQKLPILADIIHHKIREGYRCLYLNSPPMVAGMGSTLAATGIDVALETEKGRLVLTSDQVLVDGNFSSDLMLTKLEELLDQALNDGYRGLWASGDMTWEFGPKKDFSKLLEYELGLEAVFSRRTELCGVCQYHHDSLPKDSMRQGLIAHPSIVISDTLKRVNPHYLKSSWPADQDTVQKLDQMLSALCGT